MNTYRMPLTNKIYMFIGYLFLYAPMISLIIYSFNESRLVNVWGGFSLKWYSVLFHDEVVIAAVKLSLKIAVLSASLAVVLGTMCGFALARFGHFRGYALFGGIATAPMIMPEVIVGLSMLLLFVALQTTLGCGDANGWLLNLGCMAFGERGMITIWIGHATLSTAYVTVLVQSRLQQMDQSLEEAAMDLGCRPFKVFFVITLPMIMEALIAGWLLSFTLSLDDYVLAAFLSGPGSTTLPQWVFSSIRFGLTPEINALATLVIVLVTVFVVISNRLLLSRNAKLQQMAAAGER